MLHYLFGKMREALCKYLIDRVEMCHYIGVGVELFYSSIVDFLQSLQDYKPTFYLAGILIIQILYDENNKIYFPLSE